MPQTVRRADLATSEREDALFARPTRASRDQGRSLGEPTKERRSASAGAKSRVAQTWAEARHEVSSYFTQMQVKERTPVKAATPVKPAPPAPVVDSKKKARDEITHFNWKAGSILGPYKIQRLLGDGTFGRVLECVSAGGKTKVAVKVIREVKKYIDAAKIEAQVLRKLHQLAPDSGCVKLLDTFQEGGLFCLVFEPLGHSLYECLKQNKYRGFHMADVQQYTFQVLRALACLHRVRLTHTDLKPENVLLVDSTSTLVDFPRGRPGEQVRRPLSTQVKLIDFGGSTFANEHHSAVINTRQYRAPEVTLALSWDEQSDIWSAACLASELYTGRMLFPTHDNLEHLAMMEQVVGDAVPAWMCAKAGPAAAKYVVGDRINWPGDAGSESRRAVHALKRPEEMFSSRHASFGRFLKFMLRICPRTRPTPRAAYKHEFFQQQLVE